MNCHSRSDRWVLGAWLVCLGAALPACVTGVCAVQPEPDDPGNPGDCDAIVGYYFEGGECHPISGCQCDPDCRAERAPFTNQAQCEAQCK